MSRDVDFFETEFPFAHNREKQNDLSMDTFIIPLLGGDDDDWSSECSEKEERTGPATNDNAQVDVRGVQLTWTMMT